MRRQTWPPKIEIERTVVRAEPADYEYGLMGRSRKTARVDDFCSVGINEVSTCFGWRSKGRIAACLRLAYGRESDEQNRG